MDIFLGPLLNILLIVISFLRWAIILSVILSWLINFNIVNTYNQAVNMIGDLLFRITEPFLRPVRRLLPSTSGIDFAPFVLILILLFIEMVLGQIGFKFFGGRF